MSKYYTGIGSRDVTETEFSIMSQLAQHFATAGWTLRSGGAGGADSAFEKGCALAEGYAEIFIPWKGFGTKVENPNCRRYVPDERSFGKAAHYLVENGIIPWFSNMTQGAQKLHSRNYYQVLGVDNIKSNVMVYCAEDDKHGIPKGGTRTAILLARSFGVSTYNIRVPKQLSELKEVIYE